MSGKHPVCRDLEPDLVAAATGEAGAAAAERVGAHIDRCTPCRDEFRHYRQIEGVVHHMQSEPATGDDARARRALACRLADLERRRVTYRIFASPLGNLLLARSADGVVLVEYLGHGRTLAASRLARARDVDPVADGTDLERLARELLDYLEGRCTRLDWPLDFRLARGEFDRVVLAAAAHIPYGAVTSYAGVARELGRPSAARAVAQALRWNPLPIVVPCHRVVGSSGALVGYAGSQIGLKRRLLSVEGVNTRGARGAAEIARDAMYHLMRGETEYCLPTCGSMARRSLAELTLFGAREHAEALGLGPCTTCRPDLHPI